MREEKGGKAASGAPEYPWEDRAMKAAAQFMGQELLPLLGVNTPCLLYTSPSPRD